MSSKYSHGSTLIFNYMKSIYPRTESMFQRQMLQLETHYNGASDFQFLSSFTLNKHLLQDGSMLSLYPGADLDSTLNFIVSFHSLSYYADFLCLTKDIRDQPSLLQLYLSFRDAVDPNRKAGYYLNSNDNIPQRLLDKLVQGCKSHMASLSRYNLVIGYIKKYVQYYSDLNAYMHLDKSIREEKIRIWSLRYSDSYPDISFWEFCCAANSTLLIFVLFSCASDPNLNPDEIEKICSVYFPWVCGLQVILQQFTIAQDDLIMENLNFTHFYKNLKQCESRLSYFIDKALEYCETLNYPEFHRTLINSLVSTYLCNHKASLGMNKIASANLLNKLKEKSNSYNGIYNFTRFLMFFNQRSYS